MKVGNDHLHKLKQAAKVFLLAAPLVLFTGCEQTGTTDPAQEPQEGAESQTEEQSYGARSSQHDDQVDPGAQAGEEPIWSEEERPPENEIQPQRNLDLQEQLQQETGELN